MQGNNITEGNNISSLADAGTGSVRPEDAASTDGRARQAPPALANGCWLLTDGKVGMENQCLGLAEALGILPVVKRIRVRFPWRHLTPHLWVAPFAALDPAGDALAPPWPDLLIASGRVTVALSRAIRRASKGRCFTVQIQNPTVGLGDFDLVIAPAHDRLRGANVLETRGGLHRVTPERLADAAAAFAPRLAHLPRPRVAVLVGGNNKAYRFDAEAADRLGRQLADLARETGAGLMVTPSRRTGAESTRILRDRLAGLPAEIWDGGGDNPYYAYLALADAVVATCDSVNMISEACSTGKPVHVVALDGPGSAKFRRFHRSLEADGLTRPFRGRIETWTYPPLDDMTVLADAIRDRLAARRGG